VYHWAAVFCATVPVLTATQRLLYIVGQKSKLLILSKYVDKTEKIGGMWTNKNGCREKEALSDIFTWMFYDRIVSCLHILWPKAINKITARQTRTSHKHDVVKVCSIEYWATQIELVLPTFFQLLDHSQNCRIFNIGLLSSLWNIYHSTTAYFFDPPCTVFRNIWAEHFNCVCFLFCYFSAVTVIVKNRTKYTFFSAAVFMYVFESHLCLFV